MVYKLVVPMAGSTVGSLARLLVAWMGGNLVDLKVEWLVVLKDALKVLMTVALRVGVLVALKAVQMAACLVDQTEQWMVDELVASKVRLLEFLLVAWLDL